MILPSPLFRRFPNVEPRLALAQDVVGRASAAALGRHSVDAPRADARLGRSRYAWRMQERRGSGLFGVPTIIAVLVIAAVVPHVYGIGGLVLAVVATLVAFLIIGAAITLANKY
jgi:hypothetical protein